MAYAFDDASSQYFEGTSWLTNPDDNPASFAVWFYPTDAGSPTHWLFNASRSSQAGNVANTLGLLIDSGNLVARVFAGGGSSNATSTAGYTVNAWQHAVGVFVNEDERRVYLNGGNKGTNSATRSFNITPPEESIGIGARISSDMAFARYFEGYLAEAATWDVVLSDDDAAILADGVSPLLVRPDGLRTYWPLIRATHDVVGATALTAYNSPTVTTHPRVAYPHGLFRTVSGSTAPAGGFVPRAMMYYKRRRA